MNHQNTLLTPEPQRFKTTLSYQKAEYKIMKKIEGKLKEHFGYNTSELYKSLARDKYNQIVSV